jgi:hypothetical protein
MAADRKADSHIFAGIHARCANVVQITDFILVLNALIFLARNWYLNLTMHQKRKIT